MKRATDFELRVLGAIWQLGGDATVAEILDSWGDAAPGYTTILKTLQKLEAKQIVTHSKGDGRAYIYKPLISRREATAGRVSELIDTLFGGDRVGFMHAFIDEAEIDEEELARLRELLAERKGEEQ